MLHAEILRSHAALVLRPSRCPLSALTSMALLLVLVSIGSTMYAQREEAESHDPTSATRVVDPDKTAAFNWIDENSETVKQLSLQIWNDPELSFREFKTSRALMRYLETNGFSVQKNAGGLPTAFLASYGTGKPVIAFWTEEDALNGMSQKIVPIREAVVPGGPGHACGHNLIAASTVEAAVAVAKFLQRSGTKGTIRVYGTPAEETGGGKEYMLEDGLFKDVDVLLGWHPSGATRTEFEYTKAFAELHVHFRGVASHASVSPDQGRNALHALELMDVGVNYLREQLKEDSRISYVITNGGGQPNVIPADAESWYSIRANKHDELADIVRWLSEVARGAAIMTGTQVDVRVDNDGPEVLPNGPLAEEIQRNLLLVGAPRFSNDDKAFALKMSSDAKAAPHPVPDTVAPLPHTPTQEAYSTDLGNVSWTIPTERFAVAISPYSFPAHSWQFAVSSGSDGLKSLPIAAKTLAATAIDCFKTPTLLEAAKKDLAERSNGHGVTLLTPANRKRPVYREEDAAPRPESHK